MTEEIDDPFDLSLDDEWHDPLAMTETSAIRRRTGSDVGTRRGYEPTKNCSASQPHQTRPSRWLASGLSRVSSLAAGRSTRWERGLSASVFRFKLSGRPVVRA